MANIKISELDELVAVANDDYLPIVHTSAGATKKIQTSNLKIPKIKNEKTQSDNDAYSCNYINNVMQNNILGVSLAASVTPQISTYVEINTWEQQFKIGNKLNVENGKIKIGAGVNYIKIYGQLGINSDDNVVFYLWLRKNSNNVGVWEVARTFSTYVIIPINQILQVKEGDIISIATYQDAQYTIEAGKTEVYFEAIYQ